MADCYENWVILHQSFTTMSLHLCGAVDWLCDSECGECGFDPMVKTKNLQLGSTLMVSICTPCHPLPN